MRKALLLLWLLSLSLIASEDVLLKLDTQGHTSLIKDVIVTRDKDIITASFDKTIRVWDSHSGREKCKILGEIGADNEGMIFAIALSLDEQYLAVGGYLAGNERSDMTAIRIYHYPTGRLHKVLKSHTNVVYDLAFSEDGRYLVSGSADRTAKVWDTQGFTLKETITFHKDDVYAVRMIRTQKGYFAITAGFDGKLALYDLQQHEVIKTYKVDYKLQYLATSSEHIAVSGKEILVFDHALRLLKTIKVEAGLSGLAYSPDGTLLIAGSGTYPVNIRIYDRNNKYKLLTDFKEHTTSTIAVNFLDNNTAISAGGNNFEIYLWDVRSTKVSRKIEGVGRPVQSVGLQDDLIGWGNRWTENYGRSKLQKIINLKTMKLENSNNALNRISVTKGNYSLSDKKGILYLKKDLDEITRIERDDYSGVGHYCYGFYKDFIVSGGAYGVLKVYDPEGKEIASLVGHTGVIWSIALEGDRLVSGSSDQTIKVWDLSSLRAGQSKVTLEPLLNLFVSKEDEWVLWSQSGYFDSSVGGDKYVGYHINRGPDKEARYVGSDKYYDTLYRPDIISLILQTGSEREAIAKAEETRKVQTVDIAASLPPTLYLTSPSRLSTTAASTTIRYGVESQSPITQTIITHNGKNLSQRGLKPKSGASQQVTVALEEGENIITIRAKNRSAMSDALTVHVQRTSRYVDIYKPTLYLLSIGISKYANSAYDLGVADKDASAITRMFEAQKARIYKDVVHRTLLDREATTDDILEGLDWIDREATSKDVVVLFIAGHGVNDEKGNYYFLSHDADEERLRRTAVRWIEIEDTVANLPSKVILLADTCHSGNIMGKRRDITSAIKSIINSGSGSIIMTATTGNGYSYEQSSWGHGAFTKALLEGLGEGKADHDGDRTITTKEIDFYVNSRVKALTNGKQKPTTIVPDSVPEYAIGVR